MMLIIHVLIVWGVGMGGSEILVRGLVDGDMTALGSAILLGGCSLVAATLIGWKCFVTALVGIAVVTILRCIDVPHAFVITAGVLFLVSLFVFSFIAITD